MKKRIIALLLTAITLIMAIGITSYAATVTIGTITAPKFSEGERIELIIPNVSNLSAYRTVYEEWQLSPDKASWSTLITSLSPNAYIYASAAAHNNKYLRYHISYTDGITYYDAYSNVVQITVGGGTLSNAKVTVIAPVTGAYPSTYSEAGDPNTYGITSVSWTPADRTFKSGVKYTVYVTFGLETGYVFASNAVIYVNGNIAVKDSLNTYRYTFQALTGGTSADSGTIAFANATIAAPSIGVAPSVYAYSDNTLQYSTELVQWSPNDKIFTSGVQYDVFIRFTPTSGNTFGSGTVFTINGYKAEKASLSLGTNVYYLTFTALQGGGYPEKITLNAVSLSMLPKTSRTVIATVTPANAADTSLVWTSSNTSVVTVDKYGTITSVNEGTAVVTVKSAVNSSVSASVKITVVSDTFDTYTTKIAGTTVNADYTKAVITPSQLSALGSAKVKADTYFNGKIVGRIYITASKWKASTSNVKVGLRIYTAGSKQSTQNKIIKYYGQDPIVVSFSQQGSLPVSSEIAVKTDLSKLNSNTLKFYYYNAKDNKISKLDTKYSIDSTGYLHFITSFAYDVVITDTALKKI